MHKIILLRHGESQWNKENLFTGWTDVDLNENGVEQARQAGRLIKESGIEVHLAYTSLLKRAIRTLWLSLEAMDLMWIPEYKSWRLNERHYGALQGLNKSQTAEEYGEEQVKLWRRCYDVRPPALEDGDERYKPNDPQYALDAACVLPKTESLKDTFDRVMPLWENDIVTQIKDGKTVLIAAHGNTLRALVKHLDGIGDEEIVDLNIPIGEPLVYELDDDMKPIRHYYLNSEEAIAKGVERQIEMGKAGSSKA